MTLRDVLGRLRDERVDIGDGFILALSTAVDWFERAHGPIDVRALAPSHIRGMVRALKSQGRSLRTCNNYRASILYLWRASRRFETETPRLPDRDECPKLKEPWRMPTAWKPDDVAKIVEQCRRARVKRGWGAQHWEALILTIYDTGLRVGCLMRSDVSQLQPGECLLRVPGELQKSRRETAHHVHQHTMDLLRYFWRPAADSRLFPWPWHHDELWRKFRNEILIPAGLPATRRDCFHKIRRTSYTLVYVKHGARAASEHASHTEDLSKYYLDPTFLDRPNPLDALPRPQ